MTKNNSILVGTIATAPKEFTLKNGKVFYEAIVEVERLSGAKDKIPVHFQRHMKDIVQQGNVVKINGNLRSRNEYVENYSRKRLLIYVYALEIEQLTQEDLKNYETGNNIVELECILVKKAELRKTPLNKDIADCTIVFNREYRKSDYFPCIAWKDEAEQISEYEVGTHLDVEARIQSRDYIKKYEDGSEEQKTTIELSILKVNIKEDLNNE